MSQLSLAGCPLTTFFTGQNLFCYSSDTWGRRGCSVLSHASSVRRSNKATLCKHLEGHWVCTKHQQLETIRNKHQGTVTHIDYLGQISIYRGSSVTNRAGTGAAASPSSRDGWRTGHKQRNKAQGGNRQKKGLERGWRGEKIWQIHIPLYIYNTYSVCFWFNGPLVQGRPAPV